MKTRNIRRRKTARCKGGSFKTATIQDDYAIEEKIRDDGISVLYFWSKDNQTCIDITFESEDTCILQNLYYYPTCTISKPMARGKDGTIRMVYYAIDILKKKGIREITLTDLSKINCKDDLGNTIKINLSLYSFIHTKKTWYERNFGFKIKDPILAKQYKTIQELLQIDKHPNITKEEFNELASKPCSYFTPTKQTELLNLLQLSSIFQKAEWFKTL